MRKLCFITTVMVAAASLAGPTVFWSAIEAANSLYTSDGTLLSGSDLGIQLVIDVNGDSDFTTMIGNPLDGGMTGIGAETDFGGTHSTASDDVVLGSASWVYSAYYGGHYNGGTSFEDVAENYGGADFYFRWFDAADQGSASEAGIIYNNPTDGTWQLPQPGLPSTIVDTTFSSYFGQNALGSVNGSSGWATVGAVPEPGTLSLLALGLVTLAVRRKKRQ